MNYVLSVLKYKFPLPPTCLVSLHLPSTSHPQPSHSISDSLTCSLSCYILPLLWGRQRCIRHVIKREMWDSSRGGREDGGGDRIRLLAILGFATACHDTCKRPNLHTGFIFFTVGCQRSHSIWTTIYLSTRHTIQLHRGEYVLVQCIQPAGHKKSLDGAQTRSEELVLS